MVEEEEGGGFVLKHFRNRHLSKNRPVNNISQCHFHWVSMREGSNKQTIDPFAHLPRICYSQFTWDRILSFYLWPGTTRVWQFRVQLMNLAIAIGTTRHKSDLSTIHKYSREGEDLSSLPTTSPAPCIWPLPRWFTDERSVLLLSSLIFMWLLIVTPKPRHTTSISEAW